MSGNEEDMNGEETIDFEDQVDIEDEQGAEPDNAQNGDQLEEAAEDTAEADAEVHAEEKEVKVEETIAEETAGDGAAEPAAAAGEDAAAVKSEGDDPSLQPSHWCEVFVGNVPKSATADQVKALCTQFGEVYSVNLIMDNTNPSQNKGYGFVKFTTKKAAADALEHLTGKDLPGFPKRALRCSPTQSKHKLYLGNIPKEWKLDQLKEELQAVTKGLESVEMLEERGKPEQNRGFCFLEYRNQQCAQAALKVLSNNFRLGGRTVNCSTTDKAQEESANRVNIRSIYVANLPAGTTEDDLSQLFGEFGEVTKVVIPQAKGKSHPDFGFVHFPDHTTTVGVWEATETKPPTLNGATLHIRLARPSAPRNQGGDQGEGGTQGFKSQGAQGGGRSFGGSDNSGYGMGGAAQQGMYGAMQGMYGGGYGMYGAYGAGGGMLVPTMLANGQMAYMHMGAMGAYGAAAAAAGAAAYGGGQQAGAQGAGGPVRRGSGGYDGGRGGGRVGGRGSGGGSGGQRYRPY